MSPRAPAGCMRPAIRTRAPGISVIISSKLRHEGAMLGELGIRGDLGVCWVGWVYAGWVWVMSEEVLGMC